MKSDDKKTILLVEDEEITAILEKQQLEKKGYIVHHVTTGEKAVETIIEEDFLIDLILMDIDLGSGIDGTQAAEQILQVNDIPIVFLSSHTEPEIVEKTEKITSYGYVVKNSGIVVLDASIKMAFKLFQEKQHALEANEKKAESEAQKKAILNGISINIAFVDLDLRIIWVNETAAKSVNKKVDEMIGQHCYKFWANPDKVCENCPSLKAIQTKKREHIIITTPDGQIWDESAEPVFDDNGNLIGVVEIAEDITDRKQAEDTLRENEEKLTNILNNVRDVVWSISWPDFTLNYISPSSLKVYGRSEQEFMDNPTLFKEITHPDDQYLTENAIKQLMEEGEAEQECRIIKPDGSIIWVNDRSKMIYDENHQPIRVEGVTRDITGRKQLQLELTEIAERFKALHNASLGGIAIHDKGIILECNQGLSDMTGYSLSELIGMDGLLLIAPEHREMVMNKIATGYEKAYEANGLTKNGDIFPMRLEARNVPYKGKNVRTVEFRDITERKRAEEEIQKQLSEKETLLREVHHRVKNNISSIESLLSLQAVSSANIGVKTALQDALARVQSIRILYDKLLISKDLREISIKNYIEDLIESLLNVFVKKDNIVIEKHISEFSIIPKQAITIGIIINELLTNVFKYAFKDRNNGNVSISIDKKENTVTIIIQDNGIGIDERILENKSPGFGLTIVKMLVEQLNGTYSIVNENGTKSVVQFEI